MAVVVIAFIDGPKTFTQVMVIGLSNGALYALIALGYTMVYGIIELINFAHGDLFMIGSVLAAIFTRGSANQTKSSPKAWLLLALVMLAVMALCALINVTIEKLAYRRLRNAPKLAPLITAVGVSFILQNFGILLNGSAPHSRCQRSSAVVAPHRRDRPSASSTSSSSASRFRCCC